MMPFITVFRVLQQSVSGAFIPCMMSRMLFLLSASNDTNPMRAIHVCRVDSSFRHLAAILCTAASIQPILTHLSHASCCSGSNLRFCVPDTPLCVQNTPLQISVAVLGSACRFCLRASPLFDLVCTSSPVHSSS